MAPKAFGEASSPGSLPADAVAPYRLDRQRAGLKKQRSFQRLGGNWVTLCDGRQVDFIPEREPNALGRLISISMCPASRKPVKRGVTCQRFGPLVLSFGWDDRRFFTPAGVTLAP